MRIDVCSDTEPPLAPTADPRHTAACHRRTEIEARELGPADIFPAPLVGAAAVARLPRESRKPVLEVRDLERHYPLMKGVVFRRQVGTVRAVDGVSFDIREGETLGLVGESGCGKTTTINEILSLARPQEGRIVVLGSETTKLDRAGRRDIRRDLSVVFQDPMASLDPRLPVADILPGALRTYGVSQD